MKPTTITVTQEDIDEGIAINCRRCPVARALHAARPDLDFTVDRTRITAFKKGTERIVFQRVTPHPASWFIMLFDDFRNVKPFSFELELPETITP
jgi:hypothetical protein